MSQNPIALDDIRKLLDQAAPLNIIDVRTPAEFSRVHAAGARLIPLDVLDPHAIAAQRNNSDEPLYVICQSGARATKAWKRFKDAGITNVYCIEGGTTAWEKMGFPVKRGGSKVISLERQVRIVAGSLVVLGLALAWAIHPVFMALSAFVGAGLVFAGVTDYCGMAILLGKMPWNRKLNPNK